MKIHREEKKCASCIFFKYEDEDGFGLCSKKSYSKVGGYETCDKFAISKD